MPSMRSLMTAGKALDRDLAASYNCSFIAVDDPKAFDEAMYLLMNGVGVGFSVERQFVAQLPSVAEEFYNTQTAIIVADSKIGWCTAFRELLSLLWSGKVPSWDLSKLRPAGARLKVFGGRSSGPQPLEDLFRFAVQMFKSARGRRLNSLECHDLMCKVGEVVVVGGVRRSALISLSNLSDDRMRDAKSGAWWETNVQRALANNSVAYTEKPEMGVFMREWKALYDSKSGERGFFNRKAAQQKARATGRRKWEEQPLGTNPCLTSDTWIKTATGPEQIRSLVGKPFLADIGGGLHQSTEDGFWCSGVKPVFEVQTFAGHTVKATADHQFQQPDGNWVAVQDMVEGTPLSLAKVHNFGWEGAGSFNQGWLVGQVIGDGGFNPSKYSTYLRFWGPTRVHMAHLALEMIREKFTTRSDNTGCESSIHKSITVQCRALDAYCGSFIEPGSKDFLADCFNGVSSDFVRGLLAGLFDTDGTVSYNPVKGSYVRLSQANLSRLQEIQRLLSWLGIESRIYQNRQEAGERLLPDGKGGLQMYQCEACHELHISNESVEQFASLIGFVEPMKAQELLEILAFRKRSPYKNKMKTRVTAVKFVGEEEVFDCSIPDVHAFNANGLVSHNCGEITLRPCGFCNLSEVVVRPKDTLNDLREKVRVATIIGTFQSTLTNFRYLRSVWKKNAEEERLLGVSLTGVMDHPVLQRASDEARDWLRSLKACALQTNKEWAEHLGIEESASVTCTKPSGTVSQLVDCSSGIHGRFSPYYIRSVRADVKDPLAQMMKDAGIPCEPDVTKPHSTLVFSFPMRSPAESRMADSMTALEQLEVWKMYQEEWCEHNPSVTIYVGEDEWLDVGAWVWRNFDTIGGLSFLPRTEHNYKQAPYTAIEEQEYKALVAKQPGIPWEKLAEYEVEDSTTGSQELSCTGNVCELVI